GVHQTRSSSVRPARASAAGMTFPSSEAPRASYSATSFSRKAPTVSFSSSASLLTRALNPPPTRLLNCSVRPLFFRRLPGVGRSSALSVSSLEGGGPTARNEVSRVIFHPPFLLP